MGTGGPGRVRFRGPPRRPGRRFPDTVVRKIADAIQALGLSRFDLKYSNGPMPHEHLMRCIELYGTEVIPRVRRILERES